jgi:hypothetical protein
MILLLEPGTKAHSLVAVISIASSVTGAGIAAWAAKI